MRFLLFLFISIPILEMVVLIQVGGIIGAIPTVGLVVLTATLGIWLLRLEGMATLNQVQEKLGRGEIPGRELLEGIMLLIGGALLLTPGFVTDAIGFVCLLPFLRKPIAQWLINKGLMKYLNISSNGQFSQGNFSGSFSQSQWHEQGTTIEGEFEDQTRDPGSDSNLNNNHDNNNSKRIT